MESKVSRKVDLSDQRMDFPAYRRVSFREELERQHGASDIGDQEHQPDAIGW